MIFDSIKFTPKVSNYARAYEVCSEIAKKKDDIEKEIANEASILNSVILHTGLIDKNSKWWICALKINRICNNFLGFLRRIDRFTDYLRSYLKMKNNYSHEVMYDFLENLLKNTVYGPQASNKIDNTLINSIITQIIHKKDFAGYTSTKAAELYNSKYESEEDLMWEIINI